MMFRSSARAGRASAALVLLPLAVALAGCWNHHGGGGGSGGNSTLSPSDYNKVVSAFFTGVLAMDSQDKEGRAGRSLTLVTQTAPQEPAGWADLGLSLLREGNYDAARTNLTKAHELAPGDAGIEALLGLLEQKTGHFPEAVEHLRKAAGVNPKDLKARYALSDAVGQLGGPTADADSLKELNGIYDLAPDNLFAQMELARAAAKTGNGELLRRLVGQINTGVAAFAPENHDIKKSVDEDVKKLQATAASANTAPAVVELQILNHLLVKFPKYQLDKGLISPGEGLDGTTLERFLVLQNPSPTPAAPDLSLTYASQPVSAPDIAGSWDIARTFVPGPETGSLSAVVAKRKENPESPPALLVANGKQVKVTVTGGGGSTYPFPGGAGGRLMPDQVLITDFDNDFRPDLILAGAAGIRFLKGSGTGTFTDVTAGTKLPPSVTNGAYTGAWAADLEADGDLDLVLGSAKGEPTVLQNNGDGTWKVIHPFAGMTGGVRSFAWADLDGDGDDDAAFVDGAGSLHLYENARSGAFGAWPPPNISGPVVALSVADVNRDGTMDLAALGSDGAVTRISRKAGSGWDVADLVHGAAPPADGSARLVWADLDDNGGRDLIETSSAGSQAWLCDAQGALQPLKAPLDARSVSPADPLDAKRLEFVGLSPSGQPVRMAGTGTRDYKWLVVRPRDRGEGDKRINSFGVGGAVEARAGLLYENVPIDGPAVRIGLGENAQADLLRVAWPNGSFQGEFEPKANQPFVSLQYLQASCPWLFAWDGHEMKLVTDCIWRSPLGLKINAQDTAGVSQTEDWVKIRGDQLVPHDGYYDLRIAAELWETHFFDHLSLMTVDHPAGTEAFIDERFSIPPPPLKVNATGPVHPVPEAKDDLGNDVTQILAARDGNYLGSFGHGYYQGVTRDHYVEFAIGDDAPKTGPLWLVANGWIHPTDSSINVALGQGHRAQPRGLSLEVPDAHGKWVVARPGLGFPEGKIKTVLIDMNGVFKPGAPRRARLRTNLEIYWDSIGYATGLPNTPLTMHRIAASAADLHHRGFILTHQRDESSPELPDYAALVGTQPRWRDLEGFYTRYGDVKPLLAKIDDRYVIMNAGDELSLRFPVQPDPAPGLVRDYVLVGDGWVKDGNLNTTFSATVEPLPGHSRKVYAPPTGSLESDPIYRQHREDWINYHTRYVTGSPVRQALVVK